MNKQISIFTVFVKKRIKNNRDMSLGKNLFISMINIYDYD